MLEGVYQTMPDGRILAANQALVQMLGYDSEQELTDTVLAGDVYHEGISQITEAVVDLA